MEAARSLEIIPGIGAALFLVRVVEKLDFHAVEGNRFDEMIVGERRVAERLKFILVLVQPDGEGHVQRVARLAQRLVLIAPRAGYDLLPRNAVVLYQSNPKSAHFNQILAAERAFLPRSVRLFSCALCSCGVCVAHSCAEGRFGSTQGGREHSCPFVSKPCFPPRCPRSRNVSLGALPHGGAEYILKS